MSLLKNPCDVQDNVCLAGLIYGQPGVGKSTLALSAPNPVLIDADNGIHRVEKRFQVPSLPLKSYDDLLALAASDELNQFDTVIFDTIGKVVDRIGDFLIKTNPKNRQADGSLTLKAYGALKVEFQKMIRAFQAKGKHLIFIAHEKEERDGDDKIVRPDISGSSGKDLVKDLDFMGYMAMRGNKRTISFTPCGKFYAKNSLRLPEIIEIPDTAKGNTFVQDVIIAGAKQRRLEDAIQNKKYLELMNDLNEILKSANDANSANLFLESLNGIEPIWDSNLQIKRKLNDKIKTLGLAFNKETCLFEAAK